MPKRSGHGYGQDSPRPSEEAAFEFGAVYTTVKNELVRFASQESNPYTFADVAARVAGLLEAEALREQYRSPQSLPEVWQNGNANRGRGRPRSAQRYLEADVFDDAPHRRPLSMADRKRIAKAQRMRWTRARKQPKGYRRDYKTEYRKRKATTKSDGTPDLRSTPEARAKQVAAMAKHYRDPKWRKAMLKRMAAMRARRAKPVKPMSEETKAKLRAARLATIERKRKEGTA